MEPGGDKDKGPASSSMQMDMCSQACDHAGKMGLGRGWCCVYTPGWETLEDPHYQCLGLWQPRFPHLQNSFLKHLLHSHHVPCTVLGPGVQGQKVETVLAFEASVCVTGNEHLCYMLDGHKMILKGPPGCDISCSQAPPG